MDPPAKDTVATVIPSLRYRNAAAMTDWPCKASGFEKHTVHTDGGNVQHAQLTCGNGMVVPGPVDNASAWCQRIVRHGIGKRKTQACRVAVADCAARCARAKSADAESVDELQPMNYGGSGYGARDPEDHLGSFSDYAPWAEPAA
jgi:uncharacterized glyoxalase superfamily protein PhnB